MRAGIKSFMNVVTRLIWKIENVEPGPFQTTSLVWDCLQEKMLSYTMRHMGLECLFFF